VTKPTVDYLIVGGGFYGCALALFLRSISQNVCLVEADNELLGRASRVNQARVHTGFHYPRSALTAVKSVVLHSRFATDFPDAIVNDFQMLYGIARRRSKVSAQRFYRVFKGMDAPIVKASPSQAALFDPELIEQSFACHEFAFDYSILKKHLANRLDALDIHTRLGTKAVDLTEVEGAVIVQLSDGSEVCARYVFNVTYAQINNLLANANLPLAAVKHELAEIALVEVPLELSGVGITIMDGAFMSCMPYPPAQLHSLTHVRYTPHCSWTDNDAKRSAYDVFDSLEKKSRHRYMLLDGQRYVPALADARWCRSIFAVKTVLTKNEGDDGRPILFQRNPINSRIISILGGKIDNIYDLFDIMRGNKEWSAATARFVFSAGS
jgi:glycine/D-amino acid oxidase-like deaminating enzyme